MRARTMKRPVVVLGDDVGGVAALGHDAVDLVAAPQVLAEEADGHLGHHEGVAGVDALLR